MDQVWASPEMQARLLNVELSWAAGIETHTRQLGVFRAGSPDQFQQWLLGDAGPAEGVEGFSDLEFWTELQEVGGMWEFAKLRGDVDCTWQVSEDALVQHHRHRSPSFK